MKLAIVGSRAFPQLGMVKKFIGMLPEGVVVVSGNGGYVDKAAVQAASERGLETVIFNPKWKKYGKTAGPRRNAKIVKEADAMVAFWDAEKESRGTKDSLKKAQQKGIPIWVYIFHGNVIVAKEF